MPHLSSTWIHPGTNLFLLVIKINLSLETFFFFSALKELWLDDNLLTHLPENLDSLVNLKVLSLKDNPMEEPPTDVCAKGTEAIWAYLKESRNRKRMAIKVISAGILTKSSPWFWRGSRSQGFSFGAALDTSHLVPPSWRRGLQLLSDRSEYLNILLQSLNDGKGNS